MAEELFHGPRDKDRAADPPGIRLEVGGQQAELPMEGPPEQLDEKAPQHSPLREEHLTCVQSKAGVGGGCWWDVHLRY